MFHAPLSHFAVHPPQPLRRLVVNAGRSTRGRRFVEAVASLPTMLCRLPYRDVLAFSWETGWKADKVKSCCTCKCCFFCLCVELVSLFVCFVCLGICLSLSLSLPVRLSVCPSVCLFFLLLAVTVGCCSRTSNLMVK